jgi:hypothetical protein
VTEVLRTFRRDDRGTALITVIGAFFVLSLLVISSTAFALGTVKNSRRDQDWNAALAAANAGVDEYKSRINADGNYWQYGNPSSPYSAGSGLVAPPTPNSAFTGWTPVPGSSVATYRYDVDVSRYQTEGIIKLRSTGKVGDRTRSIETTLRRRSFLDFLYFTDFETRDPALYTGSPFTSTQAAAICGVYKYQGRDNRCTDINFASVDEIRGPLHSNDSFLVCGSPEFHGETSTSWDTTGRRYRVNSSCGSDQSWFAQSGDPRYKPPLPMPPSNRALLRDVDPTYTPTPGCLLTGPTKITLRNNGTLDVLSPFTRRANCTAMSAITLPRSTSFNIALPANGVIYVQDVPADSTDLNYSSNSYTSSRCASNGNAVGYPITGDITRYPCRSGDVFIEGTLKGQLTVAASNNVVVTWHIDYLNGTAGRDILGLVAENYVEVYHPVNSSGSNLNIKPSGFSPRVFSNARINAAILSVDHSFRVQNYEEGNRLSNLSVRGAIAQKFRGIVGLVNTTGYDKDYVYDDRLKFLSPPRFLNPVESAFDVSVWAEVDPAYAS